MNEFLSVSTIGHTIKVSRIRISFQQELGFRSLVPLENLLPTCCVVALGDLCFYLWLNPKLCIVVIALFIKRDEWDRSDVLTGCRYSLLWNASLIYFKMSKKKKNPRVHLHMLRVHKVFPWKINLSFWVCKKTKKNDAKNKSFCDTCLSFYINQKNIGFSRNSTNEQGLSRCTCGFFCIIFLTIINMFFGWG
jgi:hypothetical protein